MIFQAKPYNVTMRCRQHFRVGHCIDCQHLRGLDLMTKARLEISDLHEAERVMFLALRAIRTPMAFGDFADDAEHIGFPVETPTTDNIPIYCEVCATILREEIKREMTRAAQI